jgi:hypothetical protein
MRLPLLRILTAIVVVTTGLPSSSVAVAAAPSAHTLSGVTKITASTTSSVLVRFPKKVNYFKEFRPSHTGDGRVKGFVLQKTGFYKEEGARPIIQSLSPGRCDEPAPRRPIAHRR